MSILTKFWYLFFYLPTKQINIYQIGISRNWNRLDSYNLTTWISLQFTFSDDRGLFTSYFVSHFYHTFYVMTRDLTSNYWPITKFEALIVGKVVASPTKGYSRRFTILILKPLGALQAWFNTYWDLNWDLPIVNETHMKRIKPLFHSFQSLLVIDIFLINNFCSNCKRLFLADIFKPFLGNVLFWSPMKAAESKGFLTFSGGIKRKLRKNWLRAIKLVMINHNVLTLRGQLFVSHHFAMSQQILRRPPRETRSGNEGAM